MNLDNTNQQGMLVHQVFVVSKEEGQRIIDKVKLEHPNHPFISVLEKTNNEK